MQPNNLITLKDRL